MQLNVTRREALTSAFLNFYMIPSFLALVKIKSYFLKSLCLYFGLVFESKRENQVDSLSMLVFTYFPYL